MATDLTPITIAAPGFYGLNLQDSPISLPPEYSLKAENCVIDKSGRLGARKGWLPFSADDAGITGSTIRLVHEFIGTDGTVKILFIANGKIWEMDATTGAVTSVYTGTWTDAGGVGDNHWKAVTFNNYAWLFKRGEDPLRYTPGSPGTVAKISATAGYLGPVPTGNEVLSAYGRLWVADTSTNKVTINWSDTLIGQAWTGGASGSVSLETVLTNGTRPIVALAAFNGFLVIFCDTSIVIYDGADDDPATNLSLVDVIDGVGCVARDSVQDIGSDILFLSDTGVRSLGRIISEKSAPLFDVSRNIRDQLIADVVENGDNAAIKSVYNDLEGFYLLTMNSLGKTYCFDLKNRLENNACRITTWSLNPFCYMVDRQKRMFMGFQSNVGYYTGYKDSTVPYRFIYETSHLDGDSPVFYKILKSVRVTIVEGSNYLLNFLWGFDYFGLSRQGSRTVNTVGEESEYNIAEYGIGQYGEVTAISSVSYPLSGYGRVFQFSIIAEINDKPLSIQQIDIFSKKGRLA